MISMTANVGLPPPPLPPCAWAPSCVAALRAGRLPLARGSARASTVRRPRCRSRPVVVVRNCAAHPSEPSSIPQSPAAASPAPIPASASIPASAPTPAPEPAPTGPPTLMTDSVLETKWKAEELKQSCETCRPSSSSTSSSSSSSPLPSSSSSPSPSSSSSSSPSSSSLDLYAPSIPSHDLDDLTASDPYQAFARFTRIAAPTAAIGRPDSSINPPSSSSIATNPNVNSNSAFSSASIAPSPLSSPSYSTADIARRLLRYSMARDNLDDFISLFVGDFDNALQVGEERERNIHPGEGGGHEHIHCTVRQVATDLLFARYYFDGNPKRVFRTRLYRVRAHDGSDRGLIEMRILRFYEETERALQASGYDLNAISWDDDDMYQWLQGCEVFWERYRPDSCNGHDDVAAAALGIAAGDRFVGYMAGGGCELFSKDFGARIRIMDDLLLTRDELWVADRGFDQYNRFVYGNRRGIPYKMRRVREGDALSWTLSNSQSSPNSDNVS